MNDVAPWEGGTGAAHTPDGGVEKVYRLPNPRKLPEIYQPEGAFVPVSGTPVPRPINPTRPLDGRGKTAFMVLGAVDLLGVAIIAFSLLYFGSEAGVIRWVYAGVGVLLSAISTLILFIELPRMAKYRSTSFIPGMLLYGNREQFQKTAGPGGLAAMGMPMRGTGRGFLTRFFDKSASTAHAPEVVALLVNLGQGPELKAVEWDAVRTLQRGDIVWFSMVDAHKLLFYHLMVPFCQPVVTDDATKKEIWKLLRIGESIFKELPTSAAQGKTKVLQTDRDGNIVASANRDQNKNRNLTNKSDAAIPLSAPGAMLGADDQPDQEIDADAFFDLNSRRPEETGQFSIGDLGGDNQGQPNEPRRHPRNPPPSH